MCNVSKKTRRRCTKHIVAFHAAIRAMSAATAARIGQIGMELHDLAGCDSGAAVRRLQEIGFRCQRRRALYYFWR